MVRGPRRSHVIAFALPFGGVWCALPGPGLRAGAGVVTGGVFVVVGVRPAPGEDQCTGAGRRAAWG